MAFEYWQWALVALAAFIIGLSKCGIPGLAILNVAILQNLMLAKVATGFGLPLLIIGDICAALIYRHHARWGYVWRLFPWAALGVFLGYFALGAISHEATRLIIALILLALLGLHLYRERNPSFMDTTAKAIPWMAPVFGILAGFISMMANAAGPVMILYLLAIRLPKMAFLGTSVIFFMLLNLFKAPFLAELELITLGSFAANLKLAPFVIAGSLVGYLFAKKLSQAWFERLAFWLTVAAVVRMLWIAFI